MLWRLTGVRSRMLAWACLACALFLGVRRGHRRAVTEWTRASWPPPARRRGADLRLGGASRSITGLLVTATDFTRQIAAGNLSTPLPPASLRDEIGALKFSLEVMRKSLVSITRDVHQGIESALHSAAEIADGNADLSAHTQRQAASLEEAAASMAQLASTVKQNASSAFEADQKAGQATDAARRRGGGRRGPGHAGHRAEHVADFGDRRHHRRHRLPDQYPGAQCRRGSRPAGGAGKGFAVVAAEAQPGAEKRHGGARDQGTDRDIQPAGGRRRAPRGAGDAMLDIETSVKQVTQIVNEIAAISSEQHTGIDNVSRTISETDTAAQRNAARVEQASLAVKSAHARCALAPCHRSVQGCRRPGRHAQASRAQAEPLPSPRRQIPLLERQLP